MLEMFIKVHSCISETGTTNNHAYPVLHTCAIGNYRVVVYETFTSKCVEVSKHNKLVAFYECVYGRLVSENNRHILQDIVNALC